MGTWTPWGMSDYQKTLAPGIISYSTPGHGGIHVEEKLNLKVHPKLRNSEGWYEEDCEWAKVAFTFPHAFKPDHVLIAKETLKNWLPHEYEAATGIKVNLGESRALREEIWKEAHKDHLQTVCAEGCWAGHNAVPEGTVGVTVCKGGRNKNGQYADKLRCFLVPEAEYIQPFVIEDERKYREVSADFSSLQAVLV
jgi:hypothetical protein